MWKVVAEEVRTPTKEQIGIFKNGAFTNWYAAKKALAKITRASDSTNATQ
jgi:hypothetical protein